MCLWMPWWSFLFISSVHFQTIIFLRFYFSNYWVINWKHTRTHTLIRSKQSERDAMRWNKWKQNTQYIEMKHIAHLQPAYGSYKQIWKPEKTFYGENISLSLALCGSYQKFIRKFRNTHTHTIHYCVRGNRKSATKILLARTVLCVRWRCVTSLLSILLLYCAHDISWNEQTNARTKEKKTTQNKK